MRGEVIAATDRGPNPAEAPREGQRMDETMHTHREAEYRICCYTGTIPGTSRENRSAHGGICRVSICRCGATRAANRNQGHIERGPWIVPSSEQGTRMIKVTCADCGCVVRMTRKWLDEQGAPTCGCGGAMHAEGAEKD